MKTDALHTVTKVILAKTICVFFLSFVTLFPEVHGQHSLSGRIYTEKGDPISMVRVWSASGGNGAFSDIDGDFHLALGGFPDTLFFAHLGFRTQGVLVQHSQTNLDVILVKEEVEMEDVVITPGENPALIIVRKVIENRKKNDIKYLDEYSFDAYNKFKFFVDPSTLEPDSSKQDSFFNETDLLIWETVTEVNYDRPEWRRENVVASKISGYKNKALPYSVTDLQSLTVYENSINILEESFLNPLSAPGLEKYDFELMEVIPEGKDTLYLISFYPLKKSMKGMIGIVTIHAPTYAVSNLKGMLQAGSDISVVKEGRIQQVYSQINDSTWFPQQLNTDLSIFKVSYKKPHRWAVSGKSYISNISLTSRLKRTQLNEVRVDVAPNASQVADSLLKKYRVDSLSLREVSSYQFIDSLGKKYRFDLALKQAFKLMEGKIQISYFDVNMLRLLERNKVEAVRVGIGFDTNKELSKRFSVGGFVGYGTRDKKVKYGGNIRLDPFGNRRLTLRLKYDHDLLETGFNRLENSPRKQLYELENREFTGRHFQQQVMDYYQNMSADLYFRLPFNFSVSTQVSSERFTPAHAYSFDQDSIFDMDEMSVQLRWAPGESFARQENDLVNLGSKYPAMKFRWRRGMSFWKGEYPYDQYEVSIFQRYATKRKSIFYYSVNAGYTHDPTPLPKMYVFKGNHQPKYFADIPLAFNTMRFNEFVADQYIHFYLAARPWFSLIPIGRFNPKFTLFLKGAYGRLTPGTEYLHEKMTLMAPERGYYETGMLIQNILPTFGRNNILTYFIRKIGVGFYYRMGDYSLPTFQENLTVRVSMIFL